MLTIKKLVHFLSDVLLRFLLYTTATLTVLTIVLASPGRIKHAITASGAYQRFVPSIIESNQNSKEASSIPLKDEKVVAIINDAFAPYDLEQKSEIVIDSVFSWLNGSSPAASFRVDFTDNKDKMGDKLSEYAFTSLAFKDLCEVQPAVFDPFSSQCRPVNFDIFEGQKEFARQIKSSDGFMGNTILTEKNLPKNTQGKNIFEQYSYAPKLYVWLKRVPPLLITLTIIASACYVWSASNRRKGVSRLGKGVMLNSITIIVTPFIFGYVIPWASRRYSNELGGSSSEALLNDIVTTVSQDFNKLMIWLGAILLLGGLLIYIAERMTREAKRYSGVEKNSGLLSSQESKKKTSSPRGKQAPGTVPLQSSEVSSTKRPKAPKKNSKYRKIPL